jgi:GT2 family glycosyltransferase
MGQQVDISVIVPTCPDRSAKLRTLLSGIARTTADHQRFEVIVVVDDLDDGPLAAASELPGDVRFVGLTQRKKGPAAARNLAIEHAAGRWLLMFNDDAVVDADTIPGHLAQIERNDGVPRAYLGRFDWLDHLIDSPWRHLLARTSMLFFWDQMQADRTYGFRHFWTTNLSVPADLVRRVGGFNEAFRHAIHEDIELGWQLERRFGLRVQPVPTISAWHDHAITPSDYFHREYLSGKVAQQARTVNPGFFGEVWGRFGNPRELAHALRHLFAGPAREVRWLLEQWSIQSDEQPSADALRAAYLAHLPLKRLVFCQGCLGEPFDDLLDKYPSIHGRPVSDQLAAACAALV